MSLICSACSKDMSTKYFYSSPQDLPHKTFPELCGDCGEQKRVNDILVVSIEHVSSEMEVIGLVRGSTARAKNAIEDVGAWLKNIVGGEVVAYTQLIADAREQALQRLKEDAAKLGADVVVGVRFSSTTIGTGISEILAYGTALKYIVDE